MGYYLGVDLGTTYTSAAVWRNGQARVADLGTRAPVIPSVVFLKEDASILTGEAANRRGVTEPARVAREFKRRIGDTTPLLLGGSPYSADGLMARLLEWVVATVSGAEGGPPDAVAVSHPANWGPYKTDLLRQAIERADLDNASLVIEPEAAAIHYASQERVEPGSVVAVYDLGGGTFDAAVLRKTTDGFELLGEPQGIERLGGIDFDEAVFQFVAGATGGALDELDPDDTTVLASVARLRQECVEAKESLSSDTDVSIPVLLPSLQTEVRLTRAEFEAMIRPALTDTITALRRALRSADVEADAVSAVLLVGGSSRIPLVAQLVGSELGRPVAVDAHPKHGIALGAAIAAAEAAGETGGAATVVAERPEPTAPSVAGTEAGGADSGGAAAVGAAAVAATAAGVAAAQQASAPPPTATPPPATAPPTATPPAAAPPGAATPPTTPTPPVTSPPPTTPPAGPPPTTTPPAPPPAPTPGPPEGGGKRPIGLVVGLLVLVVVVVVAVAVLAGGGGGDGTDTAATTQPATGAPATEPATQPPATQPPTTAATTQPATGPSVAIESVALVDGWYEATYTATGFTPRIAEGQWHLHFFLDTTTPENAGANGTPPGDWDLTDAPSPYRTKYGPDNRGTATQLCVVVATFDHQVYDPASGNCWNLPDG